MEIAWFPEGMTWQIVALLALAALFAGLMDAIIGGGGLLQLPALLLAPGVSPVQALATNKLASIFGATASTLTYYRRVKPDLKPMVVIAVIALVSSMLGAFTASVLPVEVFRPVIVVVLVVVLLIVVMKPDLGTVRRDGKPLAKQMTVAGVIGVGIGFYDGVIGPGTGTLLIIALVIFLQQSFLHASAGAKFVNWATNLGALIIFIPLGHVYFGLGALMGLANMLGAYAGARLAIAKGSGFIRVFFLVMVGVLILKLGWDTSYELMNR